MIFLFYYLECFEDKSKDDLVELFVQSKKKKEQLELFCQSE